MPREYTRRTMDMRRIRDERTGIADLMWQELRKWCPEIVPVSEHECTDGQWRSIWGKPVGVEFTGKSRVAGYAYRGRDGVTFGKRGKTEEELRIRWTKARSATVKTSWLTSWQSLKMTGSCAGCRSSSG
jgi:hypothetical protein